MRFKLLGDGLERRSARPLDLGNNRSRCGIGFRHLLRPGLPGFADRLSAGRGTELDAARLGSSEGGRCALADQGAFFLGKSGVQVQQKGVRIGAQLRHHERHPVCHEPRSEMNVAAEPAELRHDHGSLEAAGVGQAVGSLQPRLR
jgi:hypothetical protein